MTSITECRTIFTNQLKQTLQRLDDIGTPFDLDRLPYLNRCQDETFNERYAQNMSIKFIEPIDLGAQMLVTCDKSGCTNKVWCIFGPECPLQSPTFNEFNKVEDGKCSLFHARPFNGPLCPDGSCCALLNHDATTTENTSTNFCPHTHYVRVGVRGANHGRHNDKLESKLTLSMLCTRFHRPGMAGKKLEHDDSCKCGALHFVKKDISGNEVIASIHQDQHVGYIKLMGNGKSKNPKTGSIEDISIDMSYPDHPEKRLITIVDIHPTIPDSMCSRLWYDCNRENRSHEDCHHFILLNMRFKTWDLTTNRFQWVKPQLRLRIITQSENPEREHYPEFIDHDRLIDPVATAATRAKRKQPTGSLVGGESWGGLVNLNSPKDGTISVFLSTGSNTFNE
jgi:hypothetical protein